ncbi:MAG: hypothetical protein LBD30_08670 [Verrucomicrobiales bacterium]|jgi:hypothetical protein|nr:hypothetical protein [Verrucomicrobiales bacterium]
MNISHRSAVNCLSWNSAPSSVCNIVRAVVCGLAAAVFQKTPLFMQVEICGRLRALDTLTFTRVSLPVISGVSLPAGALMAKARSIGLFAPRGLFCAGMKARGELKG